MSTAKAAAWVAALSVLFVSNSGADVIDLTGFSGTGQGETGLFNRAGNDDQYETPISWSDPLAAGFSPSSSSFPVTASIPADIANPTNNWIPMQGASASPPPLTLDFLTPLKNEGQLYFVDFDRIELLQVNTYQDGNAVSRFSWTHSGFDGHDSTGGRATGIQLTETLSGAGFFDQGSDLDGLAVGGPIDQLVYASANMNGHNGSDSSLASAVPEPFMLPILALLIERMSYRTRRRN
jgi:hypothetical protein